MATPKASGRMIRTTISESEGVASLSPAAAVLFMMMIPHFNCHGKMPGGPGVIKDDVVPYIPYLSYDNLPQYLQEISDKTNVKWFRHGGKWWLHSLHFLSEHQDLRLDKMGKDTLPGWSPTEESGTSPGLVPDLPSRAEGLKERREEEKPKTSSSSLEEEIATPPGPPPGKTEGTTTERFSLLEFRHAYHQATGELLPGGLNGKATEICQRHPRDKLMAVFEQMAMHGGKTFKYLVEVLKGKPKAVVERKTRGAQRQAAAVSAAQETLKRVREMRNGSRGTPDSSHDGTHGAPGNRGNDHGTTVVVPPGPG